ncbi:unnamed protein product [Didymodactylos carnosus]|uniref:Uncharacterized protein n=1 Tax=Didymodactylos carnosus TaxID=1234261 RepID=A0A814C4I6_9BILA|nr:unnamed protein product [Didymodactylos carnosus]CAF3715069.1 unnamed protein product [Didymodactylos carnosus]
MSISNEQLLEQIEQTYQKYLNDNSTELKEELWKWKDDVLNDLEIFITSKENEIDEKFKQLNTQRLNYLDELKKNLVDNDDNNNLTIVQQNYQKCLINYSNIEKKITCTKNEKINFLNNYFQLNIEKIKNMNYHFSFNNYFLISKISVQSTNPDCTFDSNQSLIVYYDREKGSSWLNIFDLQPYLINNDKNNNFNTMKIIKNINIRKINTSQFGKIFHIEYNKILNQFLICTGGKIFSYNSLTSKLELFINCEEEQNGIIQKFTCDSNKNLFILYKFIRHTFIQYDLSSLKKKYQWNCDNYIKCENENYVLVINDFTLNNDVLIFIVKFEQKQPIANENNEKMEESTISKTFLQHQIQIFTYDMILRSKMNLNEIYENIRIRMLPFNDKYKNDFLIITKRQLFVYNFDTDIQCVNKLIMDDDTEYVSFLYNDKYLVIRTTFHMNIFKRHQEESKLLKNDYQQSSSSLSRLSSTSRAPSSINTSL